MKEEKIGYGSWESPITAESLAEGNSGLSGITIDQGKLYWIETRPLEKGRSVLVSHTGDFLSSEYNIRTTLYEYGGKATLLHRGVLFFVNFKDQAIYSCKRGEKPLFVAGGEGLRFADFEMHPNGKWLYAVMENLLPKPRTTLVKIEIASGRIEEVSIQTRDFFAYPRISPDGKRIAYIVWDHPNMPWDQTELFIGKLGNKGVIEEEDKFLGEQDESIVEPTWSPKGKLYYISDRSGYWNLYDEMKMAVLPKKADFSKPLWNVGQQSFAFAEMGSKEVIAAIFTKNGIDYLGIIDPAQKTMKEVPLEYTAIEAIRGDGEDLYLIVGSPKCEQEIVKYNLVTKSLGIEKKALVDVKEEYISLPEMIEFPTSSGDTAYGIYYPPTHAKHKEGLPGEKPPLVVFTHGGPTTHVQGVYKKKILYWTSRGFAVCNVNYRGSSGYGRRYRDRLKGKWGEFDVDDCCNAALYLADQGKVDRERLAIRGGSAGGYTVLAALTFRKVFKVGASYYGVSDLEVLAKDTHKFEAHYLDSLIGVYPAEKARYIKYSPIHHTDELSCPIIFFQGEDDKIVPPSQSELMYKALLEKGLPTAYMLFPGESHGFRMARSIAKSADAEYDFFCKIFRIRPRGVKYPAPIIPPK